MRDSLIKSDPAPKRSLGEGGRDGISRENWTNYAEGASLKRWPVGRSNGNENSAGEMFKYLPRPTYNLLAWKLPTSSNTYAHHHHALSLEDYKGRVTRKRLSIFEELRDVPPKSICDSTVPNPFHTNCRHIFAYKGTQSAISFSKHNERCRKSTEGGNIFSHLSTKPIFLWGYRKGAEADELLSFVDKEKHSIKIWG